MSLESLTEIVPPPKQPYETSIGQNWLEVESALQTTLPQDYKDYIGLYGSGQIGEILWVFNPFSSSPHLNLLDQVGQILGIWQSIRAEFGKRECPYPLYPEPNGLLSWGYADTGATVFWQTTGNPEDWIVVLNESRGPQFERFQQPMTSFLTAILSRNLKSRILPAHAFTGRSNVFVPQVGN